MITLAVDAMGGDFSPEQRLKACINFLQKHSDCCIKLLGDLTSLHSIVKNNRLATKFAKNSRLQFIATPKNQEVQMGDKPEVALKNKKESSMASAVQIVKEKRANAVVSSGNSGALVAFSKSILGVDKDLKLPAFCAAIPSEKGRTWMLDLGSARETSFERLHQLAVKASAKYYHSYKKVARVGVLNIGTEDNKGNQLVQELQQLLRSKHDNNIDYQGFVEPKDILNGSVDIVICDGFTGNITLKSLECSAQYIHKQFYKTSKKLSFTGRMLELAVQMGVRAQGKASAIYRTDPRLYGGAFLFGVNNLVIKAHGNADQLAFFSALSLAYKLIIEEQL